MSRRVPKGCGMQLTVRQCASILAKLFPILCSLFVSWVGWFALGWGGSYNFDFKSLGELVLMLEFPAVLLSLRFPKPSICLLWTLVVLSFAATIGETCQYCTPRNCGAGTVWGPHDFWSEVWRNALDGRLFVALAAIAVMTQFTSSLSWPRRATVRPSA